MRANRVGRANRSIFYSILVVMAVLLLAMRLHIGFIRSAMNRKCVATPPKIDKHTWQRVDVPFVAGIRLVCMKITQSEQSFILLIEYIFRGSIMEPTLSNVDRHILLRHRMDFFSSVTR